MATHSRRMGNDPHKEVQALRTSGVGGTFVLRFKNNFDFWTPRVVGKEKLCAYGISNILANFGAMKTKKYNLVSLQQESKRYIYVQVNEFAPSPHTFQ